MKNDNDQNEQMKVLSKSISLCTKCFLSKNRTKVVVGSGPIPCKIIFIGEAPGSQEDLQGIPFVGRAGILFDILLAKINLNRNDVYVANILKCRPPKNRNPKTSEIQQCSKYLEQQLQIINPEIIAPMGNFATKYCCNKFNLLFQNISSIHGQSFSIIFESKSRLLIPVYHPAAAVYNPNLKETLINDITKIKKQLSKD